MMLYVGHFGYSQNASSSTSDLKQLTLEELMGIEVMSVSRRLEKLSESPSAIQVISDGEINRFGASNIPEALYLAGNLQVAQKNAHSWGISARGFNTELSNKLLVLMDGRTIYTPLYSGVFWDRQDYLLEDIQQIEVVSGPGGTLWGVNAVNGVINITSKEASQTQGLYLKAAAGNELQTQIAGRYGSSIGPNTHYRVYGQYSKRDAMTYPDSTDAKDGWSMAQGGFRVDSKPTDRSVVTVQGDVYRNEAGLDFGERSDVWGANLLGRWSYTFQDSSSFKIQSYYDRTVLDLPTDAWVVNGTELAPEGTFKDDLTTVDVDIQHQFELGINHIVWGVTYRHTNDRVDNSPALGLVPDDLKQDLYSIFLQDELHLLKKLSLILGTKLEHNPFTGWILEPNGRVKWKLDKDRIAWFAVSRAVRAPSRIDRHISQASPPHFVLLTGNPDFQSETVVSWESGFRSNISDVASTSISLFYNVYDDIRSTVLNPETTFPLTFKNGLEAETYGFEATIRYQPTDWWGLYGSYYLLKEDVRVSPGETDFNNALNENADPGWQVTLRSSIELPYHFSINPAFRWVDDFTINEAGVARNVDGYAEIDGQISWQATEWLQLSVAGRNLLHHHHVEYGVPGPNRVAIQRSVYGKVIVNF